MDLPQPERIADDLRAVLKGEVLCDELSRVLYATDASLFEIRPAAVVVPRDEEDVQALVRYAGEHQVPLIPRGAGTGMAGEALGAGIVVDLSRHLRAIRDVGTDTVRVQPGVTLARLQAELARHGRRFAPDPAVGECTVGGMVATNASGPRASRHGTTRDHVRSLRLVLDSGDVAEVARMPRFSAAEVPSSRLEDIVSALGTLLEQNAALLDATRPPSPFHRTGYCVHDILLAGEEGMGESLDLPRLLAGSEGTLAFFTEATLATIPLPADRALLLCAFDGINAALAAASRAAAAGPSACEMIDRRLLRLAREGSPRTAALIPEQAEAVLLIEFEGSSPGQAAASAEELAHRLTRLERLAGLARVASGEEEIAQFTRVREAVLPSLYRLRGPAQPLAFVEDVGVPTELLPAYLFRVQEVLRRHEATASTFVDALTGQVQLWPFSDPSRPEDASRLWGLADDIYDVALELGGTIGLRHGLGLARTPWLARQVGRLHPVLREVKAIFDPGHVFNPGKILRTAGGSPWPLRRTLASGHEPGPPEGGSPSSAGRQLSWAPGELIAEVRGCNGCGECRAESPPLRMCPIFRAVERGAGPDTSAPEAATPRAKANLLRHAFQPDADPRLLSSDDVRAVADLCVNCKMCAGECPAGVNIPKLMLEAKAANVAEHGLDRGRWVLSRLDSFARIGSALAPMVNTLLVHPVARRLLEWLLGVSRRRRFPPFEARSFLRRARSRGWTRRPHSARPRVAYFVDVFANYNDPGLAEALVAVLHHNGIEVYVPPGQRGCGMAPLAYGDVETAREVVHHNLRLLADLARDSYPILCSEPTAAVMLRHDALDLVDDPDARLVAGQTVESTAFLWDLYQHGQLRTDFARPLDLTVGHHVPCHLKALGRSATGPALLSLIPGLRVRTIDVSCSGMAGTFGFQSTQYETSLEAGRPMLERLADPEIHLGSTECSACRMQMEEGTGKRTFHPAQYLAHAYGLLPLPLGKHPGNPGGKVPSRKRARGVDLSR